ncbi:RNA 2',3'-cyclic phosphodiesterase [Pseudodonghicola xiamenensis]|uniref:RNA 2',3'-cyclic phosphodiesterase n=1 Tax=Pseudodonghicola xiamenensis TaxID=337702 RepID=A0A8J3H7Y6_9RHOB|nr:RNA 2',3'-cyclic phosphodiesterase [Pseudodonghicola xiamenensis]GHG89163.1 RNA 2',3'-cyclic phosphodiesterase [Pseudodonghicola xiamenensis]
MRAFLAIALSDAAIAALSRLQAGLPLGRPVAPENLHLTLAFLGDQPEEALEALHEELERLAVKPFTLHFTGLGRFGAAKPRLIFADVAPDPALLKLREDILRALRRAGLSAPKERFHPHVTLARLGGNAGSGREAEVLQGFFERFGDTLLPEVPVTCFGLYRSVLHPKGARYDRLADYGAAAI